MKRRQSTRAFSLVELVIVVVIIGVIAAIAVPRISRGAKGAGDSALRGSLQSLRNAIDMYAAEHNGSFPGQDGLEATLLEQLTKKTNANGDVGITAAHIYGPYLRRGFPPISVGPNAGKASGVAIENKAGPLDNTDVDTHKTDPDIGWIYNRQTGEIIANTDATDADTKPYWQY